MKTSHAGIALIKECEGCRLNAYKLPGEKYYTIGIGHSFDPSITADTVWTMAQAEAALMVDLEKYERYVLEYINIKPTQPQFDALVSYTYNRGKGGIIELSEHSHTPQEYAINIVKYWGKAERYKDALIKRRKKEQALFMSGMERTKAMSVTIAHASIDEHGRVSGGTAGDQTKKEVSIRAWYNKPWGMVIRFKDPGMRSKVALAMMNAAKNDLIGYNQAKRNTALAEARKVGYDPALIKAPCEVDCSSLVTLACIYAGINEAALFKNGNSATTSTLKARLSATGTVNIYTNPKYTKSPDLLMIGDILLTEGSHVAVVVGADEYLEPVATIKLGMKGDGVRWLQNTLNKKGYILEVDGIAGNMTIGALLDFQRRHGLVVDGLCGPATRAALLS